MYYYGWLQTLIETSKALVITVRMVVKGLTN